MHYKLFYCPKCGWNTNKSVESCRNCGHSLKSFEKDGELNQIVAELEYVIMTNPELDKDAYIKHSAKQEEMIKNIKQQKKSFISCPYCHSTNVRKISDSERILDTTFLGLSSSMIGKQWHCLNCNSDF